MERSRVPMTARNMALSTAAVLIAVLVVFALMPRHKAESRPPVDLSVQSAFAVEKAKFPALLPDPLPEGWRASNASFDEVDGARVWHVGYVTDREQYVALDQGRAGGSWQRALTGGGEAQGRSTLRGTIWERYVDSKGNRALLSPASGQPALTTVVSGTADWEVLEAFAVSLAKVPPGGVPGTPGPLSRTGAKCELPTFGPSGGTAGATGTGGGLGKCKV